MRRFWPAAAFALAAAAWVSAQDQPNRPSPNRIHRYEEQELRVPDFDAEGWVLDVGGGGEGIIGQLKPRQVVAIDVIKRELEEAPPGPLKIVMDARDLKFLDGAFRTVTAFFSLMYVREEADQEKIFQEVRRVLAPGGRFLVWDVDLPSKSELGKDVAIFRFHFLLPGREVRTGYGTWLPERRHGMEWFTSLADKTGFHVVSKQAQGRVLTLLLTR
jgi:SAM-dependent methyltransferase